MGFVRTIPVFLLPLALFAGVGVPMAAEDPPYSTLDQSVTRVRGIGDQLEIIVSQGEGKNRQYFGLMANEQHVFFTGEVTQITGDSHYVHFFRDRESLYILSGRSIMKVPGGRLSEKPFRLVEVDRGLLPEGLSPRGFWRGVAVEYADGNVAEVWSDSFGNAYLPDREPQDRPGAILRLKELDHPYVSLADYRSWFVEKTVPIDEAKMSYQIFGTVPEPENKLVFDLLELRPEKGGYQTFNASRAAGRDSVRRSLSLFGGTPRYFLSTVYRQFQLQTARPAFDEKLMEKIQLEDRTLGLDRLVYVWAQEDGGRIPGGIRLYQAMESENFLSKKNLMPIERSHPHLDVRGKFPGEKDFFELNRLAVRKELAPSLNTKRLMSVLAQYMQSRGVVEGRIILHTDEVGVSIFTHLLGAEILYRPAQTGDHSYVLTVSTQQFRDRMIPHSPGGARVRGMGRPRRWCHWPLSP